MLAETLQPKGLLKMEQLLGLCEIPPLSCAVIQELNTRGTMRRRLRDVGLIENTLVECVGRSPGGDPSAYLVRGAVIAIRREDARNILVSPCSKGE